MPVGTSASLGDRECRLKVPGLLLRDQVYTAADIYVVEGVGGGGEIEMVEQTWW